MEEHRRASNNNGEGNEERRGRFGILSGRRLVKEAKARRTWKEEEGADEGEGEGAQNRKEA